MQQGNKHKIHYHNPIQRLILHSKLQQQLQLHQELAEQFHGIDIISIIDALIKRGLVGNNHHSNYPSDRIDEVYLSLPYYGRDTVELVVKIINNWKLSGFKKFVQQAKKMIKICEQPIVQAHLLPSSKHPYYHMQIEEQQMIASNFNNVDEYLCLKTIAIFSQGTKVPKEYKQKYELVQIWQYLHNRIQQLTQYPQLKLQLPSLPQNTKKTSQSISTPIVNNKLCIIGVSVSTLLLAIRISRMGISVTLLPLQPVTDFIYQIGHIQGVFIENQMEVNRMNKILRQQLGMEIYALQTADHLQKQQKHLTILLDQVLKQWPCNSNKNLWQQIYHQHNSNSLKSMKQNNQKKSNYISSNMTGQKIDLQELRLYYNRMLMMNRVGNQNTFSVAHFMALLNQKNTSLAALFYMNRVYGLREFRNGREVLENNIKKCSNLKIQWNSRVKKVRQTKNSQMWQVHVQQQNEQNCKQLSFQRILISQLPQQSHFTQQSMFPISLIKSTINLTPIVNIICIYHFNENQPFLSFQGNKINFNDKEEKKEGYQFWTCASRLGIITFYCTDNQTVVAMLDIKDIKQYTKSQLYSQIGQLLQQWLKSKALIKQPQPKIFQSTYYISPAADNPIPPSQNLKNNAYMSIPVKNMVDQNTSLLFNHLQQNSSLFSALFLETNKLSNKCIHRSKDNVREIKINDMIGEGEESEDVFGVKVPFVSHWKQLVINATKKISQMVVGVYKLDSSQGKAHNIPWHIVQTPLSIQSGKHWFFISDLGLPKQNKTHRQEHDLIGYKCTRYGPSLVHDGQGIFKHAIIWNSHRQEAIYFMVQVVNYADQQYLLVLFHNDVNALNQAISSLQSNSQVTRATIKCDDRYIDQNLLLEHCQNMLTLHSYTETLQKKLTVLTQLKTHPLTTPPSSVHPILFLHPNSANPITSINSVPSTNNTIQKIIKTLNEYCFYYCQLYGLKEYTFTDLFLGKINLTYLFYQIQHNVRSRGYSIDFSLNDNLRKEAAWQKYCLGVRQGEGNGGIGLTRRFLGFGSLYRCQFVDYVYVLDQSQIICGYPYRNVKAQLWIRQLLLQLVQSANFRNGEMMRLVTNELKYLVHDQMKTISSILSHNKTQLQKYIQAYFLMTRMQRPNSPRKINEKNPIYKQNTIHKIMSFSQGYVNQDTFCTPEQILELGTMVDEDHIQIYDSDQFIITITP